MSAHGSRHDPFNISKNFQPRVSVTASESRQPQNLFTSEEIENMKLNNLRHKRHQLEEKLKLVSNRINFRRKKEQQELKKFIKSEQKSLSLMETHNYKKVNQMIKDEFQQRKTFELRKKAKEVEDSRTKNNRRLSLIYQATKDRKLEESQRVRNMKKIDEQTLKISNQMAIAKRKQQHEAILRMKERQNTKRKCYWFEKRMSFQQKMYEEAQIYEKQIQDYYRKIQCLKENQEKLREQQQQATELLKCAEQNYQLLKQS